MSNLIKNIAAQYTNISPANVARNQAFGVVYNNTTVSGIRLCDHASGKRVTGQVLSLMGFQSDKADVEGDLDSL
jgi:hypothetical protein